TADGTITSFDCKNATYTQAYAINGKDAIAGYCQKGGTVFGFERTPGGRIRTFAVQGSAETLPFGINDKGQITGTYNSSSPPYGDFHGFVGSPRSGFTSFDVPGGSQTEATSINNNGAIAGSYEN